MRRRATPAGHPSALADAATRGELVARPADVSAPAPAGDGVAPGTHVLEQDGAPAGLLHVPASYDPTRPAPLVVLLHGAGGDAHDILPVLRGHADREGLLVLAPDARRQTWDVIMGAYGPDIAAIDVLLRDTFARHAVDARHVAIGGFSDGASYALSLGIANGALFTHVLAFSPGFMAPTRQEGAPRLFVSHGVRDGVLPIDRCSRRLVPKLEAAGYDVRYREFPGEHTVPPAIAREAVDWLLDRG